MRVLDVHADLAVARHQADDHAVGVREVEAQRRLDAWRRDLGPSEGSDLERPGAQSQVVASTKAVRLYIDKQGEVYLEGEPIRTWVIQSRVRDLLRGMTQKSVLVVTDANVPSQKLIDVVDAARLAGAEDVGVATVAEAGEG